jgi:hypothetical protein
MQRSSPARRLPAAVVLSAGLLLAACSGGGDPSERSAAQVAGEAQVRVEAVSARADMVTGGDVLLAVDATRVEEVRIEGEPVQVAFEPVGDRSVGLVGGLPAGASTIEVRTPDGRGELEVVDHPRNGPVFSGERLPMTVCTTHNFGLAPAEPPECLADTVVSFGWIDAEGELHTVAEPSQVPPEAATVELDGTSRPAVLRVERGVINRAVYEIVSLHTTDSPIPELDRDHWNGRLVYRFGGGCGTTFGQGFTMLGPPDRSLLADGYAFATSTLNTFQVQCNDVLSAETAMMVKEHFSETLGVPELTIGEGGSGGAIQQVLIAQNYPGILDAIGPTLTFPDAASIAPGVIDCALLRSFYATDAGRSFDARQQSAVNGHLSTTTCMVWEQSFVPVVDPTKCGFGDAVQGNLLTSLPGLDKGLAVVPPEQLYDAQANPDGVRCTFQDSYVNVFGRDPATGFARRPLDNTGVQYGLQALEDGVISFEQFLALNSGIGGLDVDGRHQPQRMVAEEATIESAYRSGRVSQGGGLHEIPIIAMNVYADQSGDIHDRFRMFSLAERLRGTDGAPAPNLALWTRPKPPEGDLLEQLSGALSTGAQITRTLDAWATALKADTSERSISEKLADARPAEAVHTCLDLDGAVVAAGPDVYDGPGPCTDPYPMGGDPRTAAGAPLRNDIGKCALQPVRRAVASGVYGVEPTDAQIVELEGVFPDGVCDWTRPGVGQVELGGTWQTY